MNFLIDIINFLKKNNKKRIIFPEGNNKIIQNVANKISNLKLGKCILIFKTKNEVPEKLNTDIKKIVLNNFDLDEFKEFLINYSNNKINKKNVEKLINQPNYFSMIFLKKNYADCLLGGINYSTADILRPAFKIIKCKKNISFASSTMIMLKNNNISFFSDCALNINPDSNQMATIAFQTINFVKTIIKTEIKVAMLSFSSDGSGGENEYVIKVKNATDILKNKIQDKSVKILGDIQFDAAFNERIRIKKLKDKNIFGGSANVFIFPDLNSGNIGYKIAQNLGDCSSIGPIINGLNLPVNDLSRGAVESEVFNTALITLKQTFNKKNT